MGQREKNTGRYSQTASSAIFLVLTPLDVLCMLVHFGIRAVLWKQSLIFSHKCYGMSASHNVLHVVSFKYVLGRELIKQILTHNVECCHSHETVTITLWAKLIWCFRRTMPGRGNFLLSCCQSELCPYMNHTAPSVWMTSLRRKQWALFLFSLILGTRMIPCFHVYKRRSPIFLLGRDGWTCPAILRRYSWPSGGAQGTLWCARD